MNRDKWLPKFESKQFCTTNITKNNRFYSLSQLNENTYLFDREKFNSDYLAKSIGTSSDRFFKEREVSTSFQFQQGCFKHIYVCSNNSKDLKITHENIDGISKKNTKKGDVIKEENLYSVEAYEFSENLNCQKVQVFMGKKRVASDFIDKECSLISEHSLTTIENFEDPSMSKKIKVDRYDATPRRIYKMILKTFGFETSAKNYRLNFELLHYICENAPSNDDTFLFIWGKTAERSNKELLARREFFYDIWTDEMFVRVEGPLYHIISPSS